MVKGPEAPVRGEPQCVPPHSHVELAKLDFPWMPVPRHLGAPSLIPSCLSLPCLATLYHIQISGRPLALREHTFPSIIYVHMWKHWEDRPILRSSRSRGEVPDVWVRRGPVLHSCHCQQWLWSCHRLDRHTVLSSSCKTGICNSRVPLNCLLLNIRYFSNTSFYLKK